MFNLQARQWLQDALGVDQPFEIQKLKGATSSSVYLLQFSNYKYVLRVFDNLEWLKAESDLPLHEAQALNEANSAGIAAPSLIAYSTKDEGFGAPVLLMSFVGGRIELKPQNTQRWLETLANTLAKIHKHKAENFPWQFQSWVNKKINVPHWTRVPKIWEQAIAFVFETSPSFEPVFIHRDFHPVNILWNKDEISGVVDWTNACRGPAGVDVGHCRINLVQMYGIDSADQFLADYQNAAPEFVYQIYWDIDSVLDMCWPEPTFYKPWQEFGLPHIDEKILRQRVDEYLEILVNKL